MAKSWLIELVAEQTDREEVKGYSVFASPECGVCGGKERNADLVQLYVQMEAHKCHAFPEGNTFMEELFQV